MESSWRELRIEECRQELQKMRETYRLAKAHVDTPEHVENVYQELLDIHQSVQAYAPQQPATVAVYILAQVAYRLEKLVGPMQTMWNYQALHDKLRALEQS